MHAILNRIIPADDSLPGAGDLGLSDFVERQLALVPAVRRMFLDGIAEIALTAWLREDGAFVDLSADRQDRVLRQVEQSWPYFFEQLVGFTYAGYYVDPR